MAVDVNGWRVLDRVLDALERRLEIRQKQMARAEAALVAQSRAGQVDPRVKASYQVQAARYDEARLAFNAAIRLDAASRPK